MKLDEMMAIVNAATPGKWFLENIQEDLQDGFDGYWVHGPDYIGEDEGCYYKENDAKFASTFDPPTMKWILERLDDHEKLLISIQNDVENQKSRIRNSVRMIDRLEQGPPTPAQGRGKREKS